MTGHRKFAELRNAMSPEARARAEAKAARIRLEMSLEELRRSLSLSQKTLAEALAVDQPAVAKMEKRSDMYVSSLRRLVEAMGGELDIYARFPEGSVKISNFTEAE